jgi:hypothetical protein
MLVMIVQLPVIQVHLETKMLVEQMEITVSLMLKDQLAMMKLIVLL